jgi:hypothetical protein
MISVKMTGSVVLGGFIGIFAPAQVGAPFGA